MCILLIEDDRMIGKGLVTALIRDGMVVDWVRTGSDGARRWPMAAMLWCCWILACPARPA